MKLTNEEWATIRRAAKYTNGYRVTRRQEIEALQALQTLVKSIDAQAASTSPTEPIPAHADGGHRKARVA